MPYPTVILSIQKVYVKITIGIPYVFVNTQGTHKVHTRYTQGIHKVTGDPYWITTSGRQESKFVH